MTLTKIFSLLLALLLPCLALAEALPDQAPALTAQGLTLGEHSIAYPHLEGLADEALQASVNARIVDACQANALLARLPLVMSGAVPLTLSYRATFEGDVLSAAMLASGPVTSERPTQVWSCVNIDLRTGEDIPLDALLLDPAVGRETLTDWLDFTIAPELSAHLMNSALTPLPETFAIALEGLTLYYPIDQLSTLADRAGAVTLHWYELPDVFDLSEGGILDRIGALDFITPGTHAAEAIRACVAEGVLPGIPAQLGGSVQEATDTYRLLTDPDLYAGGRMFALEDSRFRSAWLLTDALTDRTWDASVIHGIRADRLSLFGLVTRADDVEGTDRETWLTLLGQPDATVTIDADAAELNRIVPGVSDYYQFGSYRLRLHADEEGQLTSIFLTE